MTACPRCGGSIASGQEYCLDCGVRVGDLPRRARSFTSSWVLRSLAAAAVALGGAAAAIAATNGTGGNASVLTAIGGFATAPQETTGGRAGGSAGLADWPSGEEGWTVALASIPKTNGRTTAVARAKAARTKRLREVGVLDSSSYASLHPGYWVVFSGVYASEAEATSALEDARSFARTAVVRRVVP